MKKIVIFLSIILFFLFTPKVLAAEKISIESVTLDSKSDNTEIINEATFEGLTINFDIKFEKVDDFAKYEIVIKNNTDEDYKITNNINNSNYITYEITDDGDNILTNNSEETFYVTVKYSNKIPNDEFDTDNTFIEKNNVKIKLNNEDEELEFIAGNPKTNSGILILGIIVLLLVDIGLLLLLKNTKIQKYLNIFIIVSLSLIPISIIALEQLEIIVDSTITIEKKPLAWDVLLIDTESEQKTPYVICPVKNGEEIPCRVLYDKSSEYGLQLVSVNPVATVKLGSIDPKVDGEDVIRAQNSYMRAITTLNEEALEFKDDDGISKDVRSVGSNPLDKNYPDYLTGDERTSLYWDTGDTYYYSWLAPYKNKFFDGLDYGDDYMQLWNLGLFGFPDTSISSSYWMASRIRFSVIGASTGYPRQYWSSIYFGVLALSYDVEYDYDCDLFGRMMQGNSYREDYYGYEKGLRPVFVIDENVLIASGDGTVTNPYVLIPGE